MMNHYLQQGYHYQYDYQYEYHYYYPSVVVYDDCYYKVWYW